jgi:hypothetical protein
MRDGAAPRARPTMEDVAARAGVSRALVSIVFRNQPGASEATRQRVRDVASKLGYAPDQRARLLGRKRTGQLGVAFGLQHGFHGELVEAMYAPAEHTGYELVLTGFAPSRSEGRAIDDLLAYRCEAVIVVGPTMRTWTWSRSANSCRLSCWRDEFPAARWMSCGPMTSTALAKQPSTSLRKGISGSCTSTAGVHRERQSAAGGTASRW